MRVKIAINGRNVTQDCYEADDDRGYVRVYKRNDAGSRYLDTGTGQIAAEKLIGKVEIELEGLYQT